MCPSSWKWTIWNTFLLSHYICFIPCLIEVFPFLLFLFSIISPEVSLQDFGQTHAVSPTYVSFWNWLACLEGADLLDLCFKRWSFKKLLSFSFHWGNDHDAPGNGALIFWPKSSALPTSSVYEETWWPLSVAIRCVLWLFSFSHKRGGIYSSYLVLKSALTNRIQKWWYMPFLSKALHLHTHTFATAWEHIQSAYQWMKEPIWIATVIPA